jgi:hypothetical protein
MKTFKTVIECWRCRRLVPAGKMTEHYGTDACREGSVYKTAVKAPSWKIPWLKLAIIGAFVWLGIEQQKRIEKEVSWMEKQGYSSEEIRLTLEDEYPPREDEADNP